MVYKSFDLDGDGGLNENEFFEVGKALLADPPAGAAPGQAPTGEGSQEEDSPWSHVANPEDEAESPYTGRELDHPIAAPYAGEKASESPSPEHPPCLWPVPVRDQRRRNATKVVGYMHGGVTRAWIGSRRK